MATPGRTRRPDGTSPRPGRRPGTRRRGAATERGLSTAEQNRLPDREFASPEERKEQLIDALVPNWSRHSPRSEPFTLTASLRSEREEGGDLRPTIPRPLHAIAPPVRELIGYPPGNAPLRSVSRSHRGPTRQSVGAKVPSRSSFAAEPFAQP